MPTLSQGELPKPKSWDEFEDIVWDLYIRLWDDPKAQRYGRSGQAQQGVDIYGQPSRLGRRYAGIQCKRYSAGTLTRRKIEAEIAKAEMFTPSLAEYLIATTEPRDAALQRIVREICQERQATDRFSVGIVFWEDLCNHLVDPANQDLLQKHYGDWLARGFGLHVGAPMQAPPLPKHFIPRPEVSDALKERLLAEENTAPGVLVVGAIQGLGGIGKSVLAAALAHAPEVQARFPDGILWVTLGQRPELHSLMSGWIVNALRDYSYGFTTVEAASAHLRTLLLDKVVLLVLDDVWDPAHARPFLAGGPQSRVLITTRRADVADEIGADLHQMDVMTPAQSLELLAARLGRPLIREEWQDAQRLARLVGHLPLALELAATRVMRGTPWVNLCAALEEEVARLEALESARRRRKRAMCLEAAFNLSLNALRAEDEEAWEAFLWLGILPEDVTIAAPMAAMLWHRPEWEAIDLLELLWNDALLLSESPIQVAKREWPTFRVHDLLHAVIRRLIITERPSGLGFTLPEIHRILLKRYRARIEDRQWHTLPDDGYIYNHLTWHMEQAGWDNELHALLKEETSEHKNAWYEKREHLGQISGYAEDVTRALELARKKSLVGLQCRYTLILASLNSLADRIPPVFVLAMVERGLWSPAHGLAYARRAPDQKAKAEALAGLVIHLPERERPKTAQEALAAVSPVAAPLWRVSILSRLLPYLPEIEQAVLEESLMATPEGEDAEKHSEARVNPVLSLPEGDQSAALSAALAETQKIRDELTRTWKLVDLAQRLPRPLMREVLTAVQAVRDKRWRAKALSGLGAHLPTDLLGEALSEARSIEGKSWRAEALAGLVPHLSGQERGEALEEALATARAIEDSWTRAWILADLAPHVAVQERARIVSEALTAAVRGSAWSESWWAEECRSLLGSLTQREQEAVLEQVGLAAREVQDPRWRAKALSEVALSLCSDKPEVGPEEALATAQEFETKKELSRALSAGVSCLRGGEQALFREALEAALQIENGLDRIQALIALIPHLQESLKVVGLDEAVLTARAIENAKEKAEVLLGLAAYLRGDRQKAVLQEALAAALVIECAQERVEALSALAPCLPERLLREALIATRIIGDKRERAKALSSLAPYLPRRFQEEVLEAIEAIKNEKVRNALVAAQELDDTPRRATALVGLVPHLPADERKEVLGEVLAAVKAHEDELMRHLAALAPYLPDQSTRDCLLASRAIQSERQRAVLLSSLVPHLPTDLLREIRIDAYALSDTESRARVLSALIPHWPEEETVSIIADALTSAYAIEDARWRGWAIWRTIPYLRGEDRKTAVMEVLQTARSIPRLGSRSRMLSALAPYLPESLREVVLDEALAAAREMDKGKEQVEVLARLALRLPAGLLKKGMRMARAIEDVEDQTRVLHLMMVRLTMLAPEEALAVWQNACPTPFTKTRQELLMDLRTLSPIIAALGGPHAVTETFEAIQDAGRWWA